MALPRYVEGARNGVVPWVSPIARIGGARNN